MYIQHEWMCIHLVTCVYKRVSVISITFPWLWHFCFLTVLILISPLDFSWNFISPLVSSYIFTILINSCNLTLLTDLVSASATISWVDFYWTWIIPSWILSLVKWKLMSICLLLEWKIGFLTNAIVPWLSWYIMVGESCNCFNSWRRYQAWIEQKHVSCSW